MANYIHKGALLRTVQLTLERMSIRGVHRCEGTDDKTIRNWLLKLGQGAKILNARMENLSFNTIEFDELWSWVGVKEGNKQQHHPYEFGERWTFLAVDKASRAIIACHSGKRTQATAEIFLKTLRTRLRGNLAQLVSDGWDGYAKLVPKIFGPQFPYTQIVKSSSDKQNRRPIQKRTIQGPENPTVKATSHVERINRQFRHFVARLTRRTDAFSKSVQHHDTAIEFYTAYYNYVWIQKTG
ncbi:MAG: IS1 family transposase, partial [Verrucomicrobiota bacterium]